MSWQLARIGRTRITLHPATLLFAAYLLLIGQGLALAVGAISISLHEGAHAITATLLGEPPSALELTPLGALMRLEDEERLTPIRRAVMLAAGPVASMLICTTAFALTRRRLLPIALGRCFFLSNMAIVLVNLLPALPLDGGRLIALLAGRFLLPRQVGRLMQGLGHVVGTMLLSTNLALSYHFGGLNLSLTFAGCFLIWAGQAARLRGALLALEHAERQVRRLEKSSVLRACVIAVDAACPVRQAVTQLPGRGYAVIACMTGEQIRLISEKTLLAAYLADPAQTVGDVFAEIAQNELKPLPRT